VERLLAKCPHFLVVERSRLHIEELWWNGLLPIGFSLLPSGLFDVSVVSKYW